MRDEFLSFEIDLSKKKHERENNIFLLFSLLSVVLAGRRSRLFRSGALGFFVVVVSRKRGTQLYSRGGRLVSVGEREGERGAQRIGFEI